MTKRDCPPLNHIRLTAKRLKKLHPGMKLMQIQHNLAVYLKFKKWGELILAEEEVLKRRIFTYPLMPLLQDVNSHRPE
jgi:hypothetical protein